MGRRSRREEVHPIQSYDECMTAMTRFFTLRLMQFRAQQALEKDPRDLSAQELRGHARGERFGAGRRIQRWLQAQEKPYAFTFSEFFEEDFPVQRSNVDEMVALICAETDAFCKSEDLTPLPNISYGSQFAYDENENTP